MSATLEARGVSWGVDGKALVDNVSLLVSPGEFLGIVGPNGAGKTSLLRCLAALREPASGAVLLAGRPMQAWARRELARTLAFVQQENAADADITVHDAVILGRTPHKGMLDRDTLDDAALMADALERVGLSGWDARRWHTLSGGEKQRVHLARALVQQPQVLLLDEPTNHLDIRYQLEMLEFIRGLALTTVAVLHDLNLAALFCDRILVMDGGRAVAMGAPSEVITAAMLREVFGTEAEVYLHPRTGRPAVTFVRPVSADEVAR